MFKRICKNTHVWVVVSLFLISGCEQSDIDDEDNTSQSGGVGGVIMCEYNGESYNIGDSFEAIDQCNTCHCEEGEAGEVGVVCTEIACINDPCLEKACGDPCVPCDVNDPDCEPIEIAMMCDTSGACVVGFNPEECTGDEPCQPEDCGPEPDFAACPNGEGPDVTCEPKEEGACEWVGVCADELCVDFIPPCSANDGCPEGMICSFNGCNSSSASCDPETGDIIATGDCGGGVCISEDHPCADFIPPCLEDSQCPEEMICQREGCHSSEALCDPETGVISSSDDCNGGVCILPQNVCDQLNCEFGCEDGVCLADPCEEIFLSCPEGTVCYGGECVDE